MTQGIPPPWVPTAPSQPSNKASTPSQSNQACTDLSWRLDIDKDSSLTKLQLGSSSLSWPDSTLVFEHLNKHSRPCAMSLVSSNCPSEKTQSGPRTYCLFQPTPEDNPHPTSMGKKEPHFLKLIINSKQFHVDQRPDLFLLLIVTSTFP
jgi:hypothetical protein